MSQAEMEGLQTRLAKLEGERAIVELLHRICRTVDASIVEDWLDCFEQDGAFVWSASADAAPALELYGSDDLRNWFAQHRSHNPVHSQMHIVLHPEIEVEGDTAVARSSYTTIRAIDRELVTFSTGRYIDQVRRSSDGRWRVVHRHGVGAMARGMGVQSTG